MNKEELEDKINSLARKRDNLILDLDKIQKELSTYMEKYYEVTDDYVKVTCVQCGGLGYLQLEGSKKICNVCNGKEFIWLKKWKEKDTKSPTETQ